MFALVFTKCKRKITTCRLTTANGLLASYTARKVCFLTTNYGYNEFAKLHIWPSGSSWPLAEFHRRFVFFYHNSWPFPCWVATKHSLLMTQALLTCCRRLTGQNKQHCRNLNGWLPAWTHYVIYPCHGRPYRWTNPSQKIWYRLDYCIALREHYYYCTIDTI